MAPSLITHYEVYSAAADQTTLTTPSFTPSNGEVIVVKLTTWDTANGMNAPAGGTQTYSLINTAAPGGFNGWCAIYTATISGSPGAMTISSAVATAVNTRHSMVVERWSSATLAGSPATNSVKSGTGTTATTTLTSVGTNSVVSWCMVDENSRDPAGSTYASSATQDGLFDGHVGSNSVQYFAYQSAASPGTQTFGVSNASSLAWTAVGVEVQGVTVSGDVSMSTTTTVTVAGTNAAVGGATPATSTAIAATGVNSAVGGVSMSTVTAITASADVGRVVPPRRGVLGWDLWSTLAEQAQYEDYYRSMRPVACPNCGEPLRIGPPNQPGVLYCQFDGWQYPRDWDPELHSGM